MGTSKALRLGSSICLLALAACGGGGGNAAPPTTPVVPPPVVPTVSIAAPATTNVAGFSGANVGTNFTTNLPPVGTIISLAGATVSANSTSVADANIRRITATYRGTVTSGGLAYPVFDLSVPELSLTASNVRGDGTPLTLANGGQISTATAAMTYTLMSAWSYAPPGGGTAYLGQMVTGYSTPSAAVPASGTAVYSGNIGTPGGGGAGGVYFVPSGTGTIQIGALTGNVSINVDFATNKSSGTFSNMMATPAGSTTSTPWNTVLLSGSLDRNSSGASIGGMTTTTGAPANAGAAGFSSAATGSYGGSVYGPAAQEVGGSWTLAEPNIINGKAAFGTFGAAK